MSAKLVGGKVEVIPAPVGLGDFFNLTGPVTDSRLCLAELEAWSSG